MASNTRGDLIPSPDLARYVDLRLFDLDSQDLYEIAANNVNAFLPDLAIREGMIEAVILQAWAEMTSELVFASNRIPSVVFESLLQMYGITRDFGQPPTAVLKIDTNATNGTSIPAESIFVYEGGNGLDPITFTTTEELVLPVDVSEGEVAAVGDKFTSDYNTLPVNTYLQPVDSFSAVDYVTIAERPTGGRDPETELEYFTRGVNRFRRLTSTLITPGTFTSYLLEEQDIERVKAVDNWNNSTNSVEKGHITLVVYGNEEPISAVRKQELIDAMKDISYVNLNVHVTDPVITNVNVDIIVRAEPGYETPEIVNNVIDTARDFINPMTWDWSSVVYRNEIISRITNAEGVDFVLDLELPATNQTIPGIAPLANLGEINVEVVYE